MKIRSFLAALVLSAAFSPSCSLSQTLLPNDFPRYGAWRSCLIGGGGYVQNVVFTSNPRVLYAYVDVGGVFRSDDGGKAWHMIHGSLRGQGSGVTNVRDISVNPLDADDVTIVCGSQWAPREGIFRTLDGGRLWKKVADGWFYGNEDFRWAGRNLARSPLDPKRLLAMGGGDGLQISRDAGATWKSGGMGGFYASDLRFSRDGETVLACAQPVKIWRDGQQIEFKGALFRSQNGGDAWQKIADAAPSELIQDPQNAARWWGIFENCALRSSDDDGATWQSDSQGLPLGALSGAGENASGSVSENAFSALAAGPNFLVTASNRGTFYTRQLDEKAWRKIENPKITEIYAGKPWMSRIQTGKWQHFGAATASISVDPRNPKRWFFTDWYAIYRSEDAGKSWGLSMDGVEVTVLHTLRAQPGDPARVHLGMGDNGYLFSLDGGARFESAHLNSNTKSIAIAPVAPSKIVATGDAADGQWAAKQVWLSDDAGQSWVKSPMRGLPTEIRCNSVTVAPNNPKIAYLTVAGEVKVNGGGIYSSQDGGQSWKWMGAGLEGDSAFSDNIFGVGQELAALPSGELMAISQSRRAVYRLAPGAGAWQKIVFDLAGSPHEIAAGEGVFWVAVKNDGLYRIENGAAQKIWNGDVAHVTADGVRVAMGTIDGAFYSLDDGQKWKATPGLPNRFWPVVAFAGERLLAGTPGNGAFWMPLSPAAEAPIQARFVQKRAPEIALPQSETLPENFQLAWTGSGKLLVENQEGEAILRSQNGDAQGSMSVDISPFESQNFVGRVQIEGQIEEALVALQAFDGKGKQVGWQTLFDAKTATNWTPFQTKAGWPDGATRVALVVLFKGKGAVKVRDLSVSRP